MNKNVIVIGSLVLVATFIAGFYFLLNSRTSQLEQLSQQSTTQQVTPPAGGVTARMITNTERESLSLQLVQRGTIVSFDSTNKILTLLTYDPTSTQPERLIDISTSKLTGVLCWAATRPLGDNQVIETKDAFFAITPTQPLSLSGEVFQSTANLEQFTNKFAFIKVNLNNELTNVIEAQQLAILDC